MKRIKTSLILGILVLITALTVLAASAQLDYVNIGDTTSETGHNLYGWGPIEPATHGGNWGSGDDGTVRVTWYNDSGTGANCSVPCQTPDPNGRQANFTMDNPGKNATLLQLRVLDGQADDSFDVFIDGSKVYNYTWSGNGAEFWKTHNISISAFSDKDPLNITINATGPQWSGWGAWGQLGVSWAKLGTPAIEVNKTVWDPVEEEWVDLIDNANLSDVYRFRCEVHNNGSVNLTDIRFWDIMSCSLEYADNATLDGVSTILPDNAGNFTFKNKTMHPLNPVWDPYNPLGEPFHELCPEFCNHYLLTSWEDTNGDGRLSYCDQIDMENATGHVFWYHVEMLPYTLNLTDLVTGNTTYFDSVLDYEQINLNAPLDTEWKEVCCCNESYLLLYWDDNGNYILDFCDNISLQNIRTGEITVYHVEEVVIDLVLSQEWLIDYWYPDFTLHPCETVTIEFDAQVVDYGYDCNIQYAKGWSEEEGRWVYGNDDACINVPTAPSCDYQICLEDSYGDGWDTAIVDLSVNGVLIYDDLTIVNGFGPECHTFSVDTGDEITTDYTAGSYPGENYYYIVDEEGYVVREEGASGTPGDIGPGELYADCNPYTPPPGDNCANPIYVDIPADLTYTNASYTCGRGNDYSSTCLGNYDSGEDIIYQLNVTSDTKINVTLDPKGTTYTGILIDDECPDTGVCINSSNSGSGSSPHGFTADLTVGTYYIMVDTWAAPDCIPDFNLTIEEILPPCIEIEKKVYNGTDWVDEISDAQLGNIYKFRINVTSNCCNFTEVVVKDTLSDSMTYNSTITPFPPNSTVGNVRYWNFSVLDKGETKTIEFDVNASQYGYDCNVANVTANCTDQGGVIYSVEDNACLNIAPAPNVFVVVWDNTMDPSSTIGNDVLDIATSDLDQDAHQEIVVGDQDGNVSVYENTGNDAYTEKWHEQPESGKDMYAVCVCDLNNNSKSEIICGGENKTVYVYEWNGVTGSDSYSLVSMLDLSSILGSYDDIQDLCCSDIDGDNEQELGIAAGDHAYIYNVSTGWTWNQEFDNNTQYDVYSVLCGCDLNNNGQKEFIFGESAWDRMHIWESTAPNTYTWRWTQKVSAPDGTPYTMDCCNMDKDVNGYQELFIGDNNGQLIVVTNTGNLAACSYSLIHDFGTASDINKLVCGDEDDDGMNDIYLAMDDDNITDLEFFGTDVTDYSHYFKSVIGADLANGDDAMAVHCTDLDEDGLREVIAGYWGTSENDLLFVLEPAAARLQIDKKVYNATADEWVEVIDNAIMNGTYRFRVNITSTGCNFTSVTVVDTLSSSLTYANNASPFDPNMTSGNVRYWNFSALDKGETKTIEFDVNVTAYGYDCNIANVTAYCADTGEWVSSPPDTACINLPSPDMIVTTITLNYDYPGISGENTFFGPEPGPGARTQYNNISARIEENGWEAVTHPFNVTFKVNGNEIYSERVPNLTAHGYAYVHCDGKFSPFAGTRYNLSVTVDANDEVTETNENNNVGWRNRTAKVNGYKGDWWQSSDKNLTNVQCHPQDTINLTYSVGNSSYQTGYNTQWTVYTTNWTASDLPVLDGANIEKARLYVYYTFDWSSGGEVYNNFTVNFNGDTITRTTVYTDRKNWGTWDNPAGMIVYDVTGKFNATGNNVTLYNNETTYPHHVALNGMLMMVIYKHPGEPERVICIDEGYDMLYARTSHGVSTEEATTYASFGCCEPLNVAEFENATLISIAPDATQQNGAHAISFNGVKWVGTQGNPLFNQMGLTEMYNNETEVKNLLQSTNNTADYQSVITTWGNYGDAGDYFGMCNAILVLEKPMAAGTCGDVAPCPVCDGDVNMGDVVLLLNNVTFRSNPTYNLCNWWAGDAAPCPVSDGDVNMGDVVLLLNNVTFRGNPTYNLCCA